MPLLLHKAILVTCSMKVSGRTKSGIGTIPDMLRGEKLALRSPTILVVWCGLYRSFPRAVDTFAANVIAHNSEIDFHMLMGTSFTQFVSEKQEHRAASRMLPQPNATLCHPTNVQDAAAQSLADALAAHAVDVRRVKMFVMEVPIAAYMTSSDNWARLHSTMRAAAACASVPNCLLPPLHSYEHAVYVRPDVTLVGPPLNFARACAATNGLMIVSGPRNSGRWWHLYDSDLAAVACGDATLLYDLGSGWVAGVGCAWWPGCQLAKPNQHPPPLPAAFHGPWNRLDPRHCDDPTGVCNLLALFQTSNRTLGTLDDYGLGARVIKDATCRRERSGHGSG
jgi:hypothetical protein